jgi:hypothetical protein
MSAPLAAAYRSIRELLAQAGRAEVSGRHEVGTVIVDIKRSRHKYGTQAIQRLAKALGTDEQTLYRCASVAECWTKQQMAGLLARTTAYGQPLTWSHFVVLATVPSPKRRAELFERALHEGLSVRVLTTLIDDAAERSDEEPELPALGRLERTTERLARELESIHSDILSTLPKRQRSAQRTLIEQAIAANERLAAIVRHQAERLKTHHDQLRAGEHPGPRLVAGAS